MSNLTENKLNLTLTAADVTAITTALTTATAKLPAVSLNDEQRAKLKSIDVSNKIFVQDAIMEIGASGTGVIPPYINIASVQNDLALFEQLDAIESLLNNMKQRLSDGKRIAGDEAYGAALAAYRAFESASEAGIMNAKQPYERLRARFEGQASGGRATADQP